jgi:hypothetical protein
MPSRQPAGCRRYKGRRRDVWAPMIVMNAKPRRRNGIYDYSSPLVRGYREGR